MNQYSVTFGRKTGDDLLVSPDNRILADSISEAAQKADSMMNGARMAMPESVFFVVMIQSSLNFPKGIQATNCIPGTWDIAAPDAPQKKGDTGSDAEPAKPKE